MIRTGLSVVILVSFCVPSFALPAPAFLLSQSTGCLSAESRGTQVELYVAPDGQDANPGTKGRPFATLTHARDAVRQMKKNAKGTITVYLRGGTYYLDEPLVFTTEDSGPAICPGPASDGMDKLTDEAPVRFVAYKNEKPVLSGGKLLKLKWTPHKDGVMKANVPADVKIIDQLFVNGKRQHMARFPNFDARAKFFGGTSGDAISAQHAKSWNNPAGGYMHALHSSMWGSKHYRIVDVDSDGKIKFQGGWQENRGGGWDQFYRGGYHKNYLFVENILDELDAEAEWYFDEKDRILYLKPEAGTNLNKAEIIAAGLTELIVVKGSTDKPVKNITFKGITFRHTKRVFLEPYERLLRGDWSIARLAAVRFTGAEDCSVQDCAFEDLGGNGLLLSGYNRNVDVLANRFTRLGESGVCIVGDLKAVRTPAISYSNTVPQDQIDLVPGPNTPDYPKQCRISNNLMDRFGIIGKQVAGVMISMAEEITVSHNTIYQCPRAAICINDGCWGGHLIEYNDAFNTVRESGDHGPFNSWGRDRWWKTSYNGGRDLETFAKARSKLDNYKVTQIRYNRFSHPGGHSWGIDLDDGSSNYHVYSNLCLGMGIKLREGFYRRVENNIIIHGFFGFHIWLPGCDDVVERNIVVDDNPYRLIRANPNYAKSFNRNLFWNEGGHIRFDKGSFEAWKKRNLDTESLIADPLFIDPAKGDYRVRPNSPALKLGFKNFPMDNFGVLKPDFRAEAEEEHRLFDQTKSRGGSRTALTATDACALKRHLALFPPAKGQNLLLPWFFTPLCHYKHR